MTELKKTFRPEFLNRLDATVVFHSLTREQIREIVDLKLHRVRTQLAEQQLKLELSDDAKDFLAAQGLGSDLRRPAAAASHLRT